MSIKALRGYPTLDSKHTFTWNVTLIAADPDDVVAELMGERAMAVAKCKDIIHDLDNSCLCRTCSDWWAIRRRYT